VFAGDWQFSGSPSIETFRDGGMEVAFAGRSNVANQPINALTGPTPGRTSHTPGRTQN